ncbi:MAG: ArsR/SmtB family transcription factor [Stackebrandtia sp.]
MTKKRKITDPEILKGLAHPMRVRLYQLLSTAPATVGDLAKKVGGDPGQVSYHLRELEKRGFIEEAPELSRDLRQSWWRSTGEQISFSSEDFDTPGGRFVADTVKAQWVLEQFRQVRAAEAAKSDLDLPWRKAMSASQTSLYLDAEELTELGSELLAVFDRWNPRSRANRAKDDDVDRRAVRVFYHAIPEVPPEERR